MNELRRKAATVFKYGFVYIWVIFIMVPLVMLVLNPFKTRAEINRVFSFPSSFYLENFDKVFASPTLFLSFLNTFIIVFSTALVVVLLVSLATYAIARRREKIFIIIYFFLLSAMMIPISSNMVAIYRLIIDLGLNDTRLSLILLYSATGIPMATLFYTGFIKGIPAELDQSAMIDGCNYYQRFYLVIFPLLKPVTVSYVVISIIGWWNDLLMPLLILSSPSKRTITLGIYNFVSEHGADDKGAIYALLLLSTIPLIIIFIRLKNEIYAGITSGALKF